MRASAGIMKTEKRDAKREERRQERIGGLPKMASVGAKQHEHTRHARMKLSKQVAVNEQSGTIAGQDKTSVARRKRLQNQHAAQAANGRRPQGPSVHEGTKTAKARAITCKRSDMRSAR